MSIDAESMEWVLDSVLGKKATYFSNPPFSEAQAYALQSEIEEQIMENNSTKEEVLDEIVKKLESITGIETNIRR